MKVMFDINVVLDIAARREPFFSASRSAYLAAKESGVVTAFSAHAFTTFHYLVSRFAKESARKRLMNWLDGNFTVASVGNHEIHDALASKFKDFEDAVVEAAAVSSNCNGIVTRNAADFTGSRIPVWTPDEFLSLTASRR